MHFGYTEDEARALAGIYVGTVYTAGGISAVIASGELAKQFGEDVAAGTKPGASKVTSEKGSQIHNRRKIFHPSRTLRRGKPVKVTTAKRKKVPARLSSREIIFSIQQQIRFLLNIR